MNSKFRSGVVFLLLTFFMSACYEDHPFQPDLSGFTVFRVHLTDSPTNLEAVNIDLKKVIIIGRGQRDEVELETEAGIYNLLDYQNGLSTVIANSILTVDFVSEIRLVLGEDNSVVVDGEEFPLKIPSGSSSGLKIKTCIDLSQVAGYDLMLDFDAAQSVHQLGNGNYQLKPVIKVLNEDARCGGGGNTGEEEDDDISVDELPTTTQEYLAVNFDGYEFDIDSTTLCGQEDPVILVKARLEEESVWLFFDAGDGTYLLQWIPISTADLPQALLNLIPRQFPPYRLNNAEVFRVEEEGMDTRFLVRIQHPGGKKVLEILSDGSANILCQRELKND